MEEKQRALEFLENINQNDKVGLIFHDDTDGFISGLLLWNYLLDGGCKIKPLVFSFGKQNIKELKEYFSGINKFVFADIAPNGILGLNEILEGKQVLSIDHHKEEQSLPKNIINYRSQGYVPASWMAHDLIGGDEFLAMIGMISDAGDKYEENKQIVEDFMENHNTTIDDFRQHYVDRVERFLIYFEETLEAFDILKKIKSKEEINKVDVYAKRVDAEFDRCYREFKTNNKKINNINFYYFHPKFGIGAILANKISREHPDDIFIFVKPSSTEGTLSISARNQNRKTSMIDLVKAGIAGLTNATGGGHPAAAGGAIMAKDLQKFKDNLKNYKF